MTEETQTSELETLKARADQMGMQYHPKIGVDKLREKINAKLEGKTEVAPKVQTAPLQQTKQQKFAVRRKKALELVRVIITCMNPTKQSWEGEIISVGSSKLGTIKRFVPFGNDNGWHVERILLNEMRARKCTIFHTDKKTGNAIPRSIPEFSIQELDKLTGKELSDLAHQQARSGAIDNS